MHFLNFFQKMKLVSFARIKASLIVSYKNKRNEMGKTSLLLIIQLLYAWSKPSQYGYRWMSFDKRNMNLITEELESLSPKNGKFLSNFSFFLKNGLDFLLVKNERHVKRLQHSETYLKHENYAYSYELKIKIHYTVHCKTPAQSNNS
jgi:hypothetical protein